MTTLERNRRRDPWSDYRRRATEGLATWLSRLPGGLEAHVPEGLASPQDVRAGADRLHAFARDVVTTNPVTREPLSPVQIHMLELVLEAVDWPAIAAAGEPPAVDGTGAVEPGS